MARLMKVWAFLDIPSGAILGVYTGSMILMTWIGFFTHRAFPDGAVTTYLGVVSAFTANKMFGNKETSSTLPIQAEGPDGK